MHCRSLIAVALGMLPIMFAQPIARGSTYSIAVIDKSRPSIYWELNETNGTAKDLVGDPREGANDGTYENVAFGASGPRPSDGLAKMASGNSASSVNRVGAIRHARLSTVARVPNDNYSVQCWFKSTAPFGSNVVHTIIGRGNGPTQARDTVGVGGAGLTQQGRLYFYEPVSNQIVSGLRAVYSNTWYHLVFLRSGRNVKVYLNGRLEIDTNVAAWGGGSGEHLTIGNRTDYVPLGYAFGMQGSVDEVAVWGRPLAATEVTGLYEAAGPSPLAPPPTLFADATVPHEAFLVQEGQASAAIVVGEEGSPFYHWVAEEVQRYLRHLTGAELSIVRSDAVPPAASLIVLGGPKSNPLSALAEQKQLIRFAGLKQDGFVVQTIGLRGRPAVVAAGNDEASTMYAAYELLERLGVVFQLTGDIIPRRRPDLKLPAANLRMEPALKYRGLHMRHFVMPWMGLDDFRRMIDQMAKLKFNYLEFYWYVGEPWNEYSYRGEKRRIEELYTKDWSYLTWPQVLGPFASPGMKVGRQRFEPEWVRAPEFAPVKNAEQAHQTAQQWLKQAIRYAHQRKIRVWLGAGDCPTAPPNLARHSPRASGDFFGTKYMAAGDSVGLEIWEAMVESTLKTYPEADGCWIWLAEGGCPATGDAESQKVLRQYEIRGKRPHSDSDLTLIHYGKELVGRIRRRHPDARLGLALLFRSRLFRMLDTLVPKDVPFASMESRPYSLPQMDDFGGLGRRETFLVPRLDEDINALAMRFAVSLYDNDGVLTGSARHCVGGVAPQTGKLRGLEQNARYLAEGAWNPQLTADQFYQGYLGRIFGAGALDEMLKACNLLEENDRAMNWDGLLNFCNYGGSPPIVLLRERCEDPFKRARPPQAWHGDLEHHNRWRQGFAAAIVRLREAASHLEHARPKTLGGSQHELEFLIFKTESYALHLETIRALLDGAISYDKLVQARLQGDKKEVRGQFDVCRTSFAKARDLARQAADLISAKAEDPDEKCILFRHHVFYVSPIEEFCRGMERWSAPPL